MIKEHVLPTLTLLSGDQIPNIRFNVAKSLEQVIVILKKQTQNALVDEAVKPVLNKMKEDSDIDVKFFSLRALSIGMLLHLFFIRIFRSEM